MDPDTEESASRIQKKLIEMVSWFGIRYVSIRLDSLQDLFMRISSDHIAPLPAESPTLQWHSRLQSRTPRGGD